MRYILILIFLFAVLLLNAGLIPQHYSPPALSRTGETTILLNLIGQRDHLLEIVLSYRVTGQYAYQEIVRDRAEINAREVVFKLPPLISPAQGYEYFFTIKTSAETLTLPEHQPQTNPYRVFTPLEQTIATQFILLNPQTELDYDEDLVFGVSLYNLVDMIDPSSVRLYLNDRDITAGAAYSSPLLVYTESKPRSGTYNFQVRALTKAGRQIHSPVWNYSVSERPIFIDHLPLDIRGQAVFNSNLRNEVETADDQNSMVRSTRNNASLRFNLQGRQDWLAFRTRLYLSSYESSSGQPVNRFTLGFRVPHLELDIIDSSPDYGSFLLRNMNIRGISAKTHYGIFSLQSAYGESRRAVDGKSKADSTLTAGTFQRSTFAGRLEIGKPDFLSFGVGFAKNKDRIASLDEAYYLAGPKRDDSYETLVTPKDNIVFGSDVRLALDNRRFIIGAEFAASLYNSNIIDGALSKEELEDYLDESVPFDPETYENIIIINKNIEPIIPNMASIAYRLYLNWFIASNSLTLSYSEVGASFRSLSAGYLQNDARILSISDNIRLFDNQLLINAGLNLIRDNLSEQKIATTTNINWYIQSIIRLRNMPYFRLGYNMNNYSDDLSVVPEPGEFNQKIDQRMGTINLGAGYNFTQIPFSTTTLDVGMNISEDKDLSEMETFDLQRTGLQVNLYNALRDLPLTTRFTFSNSIHKDAAFPGHDDRYYRSYSLRNEYALLRQTVRPFLNLKFNTLTGDQEEQQFSNYELGTIYQPLQRTTVNTSLELMSYQNRDSSEQDYSLLTWRLNITQRF